jgi:hypothetical protein
VTQPGDKAELALSEREMVALYLLLAGNEDSLDDSQRAILARLTALIYDRLSVDELENIDGYYQSL